MAHELYEEDFLRWTEVQAEALRAEPSGARGSNVIDWELVAEEVEDLGKRELRGAESLLVRIIEHLHKIRAGKRFEPREHWKKEVRNFRRQLIEKLTPTLRARLESRLDKLHLEGAAEADRWSALDEPFFDEIDPAVRWSLPELLGEADDPLPPKPD